MFGGVYSWRLKRRQHALALAWCGGDQRLANWLLAECHRGVGRLKPVDLYRHMAYLWLQHVDHAGARYAGTRDTSREDPDSPHDPVSRRVRRLMSQMPMEQRMALSLVDLARLSYKETAAVMNTGLFEVQYHIVTARRQLLEAMNPDNKSNCLDPVKPVKFC